MKMRCYNMSKGGLWMNERQMQIIKYVSERGKVRVKELASYVDTSEVTVRKDLTALEEQGILKREQGYATLKDTSDINYRIAVNYDIKKAIAKEAIKYVANNATIMIDAGSTCAVFAQTLGASGKQVTVITNASYLVRHIQHYENIRCIVLGGEYQKNSQAMVGPLTKLCAEQFRVDKIFVGTDGYSKETGFTGDDMVRAETVRVMAGQARETYVLTEASKFNHPGTVSFLHADKVSHVITSQGLSPEILEEMALANVQVTVV